MERAEGPPHTDHRNARSLRKENKEEQRLEREKGGTSGQRVDPWQVVRKESVGMKGGRGESLS